LLQPWIGIWDPTLEEAHTNFVNRQTLANIHNLQDENSLLFQTLEFDFMFNHHHNKKLTSSNNIWKWTLKLNPMVATKCNTYKSSPSHPVLRNWVLKYSNVACIGGWLLCLAMGVSLDKYGKKIVNPYEHQVFSG